MKDEVMVPLFELVSNPTINKAELKQAIKDGTVGQVKITDTVSGKTTTFEEMVMQIDNLIASVTREVEMEEWIGEAHVQMDKA